MQRENRDEKATRREQRNARVYSANYISYLKNIHYVATTGSIYSYHA